MSISIKPLEDRIVVQVVEAEQTTASGLVIPDTAKEKPRQGKVLSLGEGKLLDSGKRASFQVKEGDRVLFTSYAGNEVTVTGIVGAESGADMYMAWVSPDVMSTISPFDTDMLPVSSSTQIALADGADLETVRANIQDQLESLPGDTAFLVQTPQEQTEDALEDMAGAAAGLSAFLLAFAMLAVLVAFLVITTTFGVLTAQRARELALLRCLGAAGGQLQRSVLQHIRRQASSSTSCEVA